MTIVSEKLRRIEISRRSHHDGEHRWDVMYHYPAVPEICPAFTEHVSCFTAKEARAVARLARRGKWMDIDALQAPLHTPNRCECNFDPLLCDDGPFDDETDYEFQDDH